ncbi:hypothetical protein [Lentzea jiangxiensis]|uniref:Uncharacterized protein n=1 Tax=Lentzea jiangxiensis TaxID=641025 RepID=A0A1H0RAY2_9PSEU|nr:hypothetical protein [Lentzea jiangxiensis]SDP26677.1 hypothetical protein SAMN05421507_106238 [Lentzea jiangxiensis]
MTRYQGEIAAAAVMTFGFGVLVAASLLGLGDPTLPSLTSFRSATVGDGLLLPMLAYASVRAATPIRHRGRVVLAGVAGCAVGAATQVWWLADPAPRLNWTFPAPGTFNAVGWYHALFLTVACGFFAATAMAALDRARQAVWAPKASAACIGMLFPVFAFTGLLALDNDQSAPLLIGLASAVVAVVLAITTRRISWPALVCAAAAVPALSFSWLFLPGLTIDIVTVLPVICAVLVGVFAASTVVWGHRAGRFLAPLCTAATAAGPVHVFTAAPTVTIGSLVSGCLLSVAAVIVELLLIRPLFQGQAVRSMVLAPLAAAPVTALALSGRYFAQEPQHVGAYGVVVGLVATFLFLFVTAELVRSTFDAVIEAEKANAPQSELGAIKWSAYLAITAMYMGTLLACLATFIGNTPADRWKAGAGDVRVPAALMLALALTVVASRFGGRVVAQIMCLAWAALMCAQLAAGYEHWAQAALSLPVALLAGLFAFESIIANVGYLHLVPVDGPLAITATACALVVGTTIAWMTGPALQSAAGVTSVPYALVSLAVGWAACLLLPRTAARAMPGANPVEQHIIGVPLAGVLQDSLLGILLGTSLAWVPVFALAHLEDTPSWLGAIFPYFALLSKAYVYVMKNNIEHVHRERDRITANAPGGSVSMDAQLALRALGRHISRQNRIALAALLPLGFLSVLPSETNGFDREGLRQLWRV